MSTKFVNPYTFIPINQNKIRREDPSNYYKGDLLSGFINCELVAKTPLFIPDIENTVCDEAKKHNQYRFYKLNNEYAIPGSSIRGTIRSIYEIITNSCMSTTNENEKITRRVKPNNAFEPVIIKRTNDRWEILEADRIPIPNKKIYNYKFGDEYNDLYDLCKNPSYRNKVNIYNKAYVYKGEKGPGKNPGKTGAIFVLKPNNRKKIDSKTIDEMIKNLDYSYQEYNNPSTNKELTDTKNNFYDGYEDARKNKKVIPCYYRNIGGKHYLSLAAIGRSTYYNNINDILMRDSLEPCNDRDSLCKTCMLFGMVGDTSYGSRLRFTDAKASSYINSSMVTLKELSGPKISYLPFYVKGDYDSENAKLSGRKMYWHQPKAAYNSSVYSTNEKNNRNITSELLNVGSKFQFKVYFDRITKEQLSNLLWALTLGENSKNSKYCHKIGHGKPIGLGSCKITVESIYKRTYYNDEYKLESIDANEMISKAMIYSKKDLLNVCNFTYLENIEVSYPYVIKNNKKDDPFKWFAKNKYSLPEIGKTKDHQFEAAQLDGGSYNRNKRR